jgi:glycosyltransferase involved in cell wall biosynthesis
MKPKIAVNTRFLIENKLEGIGWFTYQSLKHLVQEHPELEWHFIFDRPFPDHFIFGDNVVPHVLGPKTRHPVFWYYWFEYRIPALLKRIGADLFFSTDGYLSLRNPGKSIVVIHDLAFEHFENHTFSLAERYMKHFTPKYAQKADKILTVSQFSKQDIQTQYGIEADKIEVVYNGASDVYRPISEADKQMVRKEFMQSKPYFLYAGSIHPRKNVARLLQAFDQFKQKHPDSSHLIALAGRKAWKTEDTMAVYEQMDHKESVVFLGHLPQEKLSRLVASAEALTYVSLFEGFGIPIIEAMQSDVPVITSNVSSMKEIGGSAALLVNPESVMEIAQAMESLAFNSDLQEALIQRGREQVQQFSWEKTAQRCWQALEPVLYA